MSQQGNVGAKPRRALVRVRERLQVGEMDQQKQALLEGVVDCRRRERHVAEHTPEPLAVLVGNVRGSANAYAVVTDHPGLIRRHQAIGKQIVQRENLLRAHAAANALPHEMAYRLLVVEDHRRFNIELAGGALPLDHQTLGVQQRVGVAFQP